MAIVVAMGRRSAYGADEMRERGQPPHSRRPQGLTQDRGSLVPCQQAMNAGDPVVASALASPIKEIQELQGLLRKKVGVEI